MCQQRDGIARGEVLARLLVVLLVEAAQQFLKYRAHVDVGQGGQRETVGVARLLVGEVDVRVGDFLNHREQAVVVGELAGFGVILKIPQHVAHILAVAVEVFDEVVVEQVVVVGGLRLQPIERPFAGVEIAEAGDVLQHALVDVVDSGLLYLFLHLLLGGFEQRIQSSQHHHGEDDIAVLSA